MRNQRIPDPCPEVCYSDEHIDSEVLHLMLADPPWPWSIDEIARQLGSEVNAVDAIGRLVDSGLLHRWSEFVFPTRTARRAYELQVGTG